MKKEIIKLKSGQVKIEKQKEENIIEVKGPCGIIKKKFKGEDINFIKEGIFLKSKVSYKLFISLLKQMVEGVRYGYFLKCTFVGLGYRFVHLGDRILFKLGYSHYIRYNVPKSVYIIGFKNQLIVYGLDLEEVSRVGNIIKKFKKINVYKGKGIFINDEKVVLKVGKKR